MPDLLTIEQALEAVLSRVRVLPTESVDVASAAGRVLAAPARARTDLPPFPSSAMDGFAVRAADTPGTLPVAFRIPAGAPVEAPLPPASAAGIATGAVVPTGADSVVPIERVVERNGTVTVAEPCEPGAHVRPRGGDVGEGDELAGAGAAVGAVLVGALAAAGVGEVQCARRPRVAVLATGSELRAPGADLGPGQIYESNGAMLAAVLAPAGATVERLPVVADDERAHRRLLERGLEADVLVTSGGVSVGPHDLVRRVLSDLGVEEVFWGVAVKPGKPLAFGVRGDTLVFGLPGNPVSSLVASLLFVRPALSALQGASDRGPRYEVGSVATALVRNAHRDELVRARRSWTDDGVLLEPVSGQESHMIVRASSADALVHVPRGSGEIPAGSRVRYLTLSP